MATILAVSDEEANVNFMERALTPVGHRVLTARSAHGAFACIEALRSSNSAPELLITDLYLGNRDAGGKKDAKEACCLIIQVRGRLNIPVILATGSPRELDWTERKILGITSTLAKPFGHMQLISEVKRVLERPHPWVL